MKKEWKEIEGEDMLKRTVKGSVLVAIPETFDEATGDWKHVLEIKDATGKVIATKEPIEQKPLKRETAVKTVCTKVKTNGYDQARAVLVFHANEAVRETLKNAPADKVKEASALLGIDLKAAFNL